MMTAICSEEQATHLAMTRDLCRRGAFVGFSASPGIRVASKHCDLPVPTALNAFTRFITLNLHNNFMSQVLLSTFAITHKKAL